MNKVSILVAIGFVVSMFLVSFIAGILDGQTGWYYDPLERRYTSISDMLANAQLEANVEVTDQIGSVLPDLGQNQQFYLTEENQTIKVLCTTTRGRVSVSLGDTVTVPGKFLEQSGELIILTECSKVRVV
jgi:hypothetical protein